MKKQTQNYLMLGAGAVGLYLLFTRTNVFGGVSGLGRHHKHRHRQTGHHAMPRLAKPQTGSPLAQCSGQLPPQSCSMDFEVMTSPATFGDCGNCCCF